MPAVRMNSDFYLFLYHHGFAVNSIHEGFHLPLSEYELPQAVVDKMEKNKERGLFVEIYDPNKHYGVVMARLLNKMKFALNLRKTLLE